MKAFRILLLSLYFVACGAAQEHTKVSKTLETKAATKPTKTIQKHPGIQLTETIDIPAQKVIKKDSLAVTRSEAYKSVVDTVGDTVGPKTANKTDVLETKIPTIAAQPSVVAEAKEIISHAGWDALLQKHVSASGVVNYKGFIQDKAAFRTYLQLLYATVPAADWTKAQKLAYWMNAYNAFTIKLIIDNYPLASIKDLKNPWDQRLFKIGKKWYNLNEIEHQILRKMGDPRIHFGINCASFSCPPLPNRAFTPDNMDKLLEQLAIAFVNDPKRNTIGEDAIEISKIFQWFVKDFKTKGSLIDFLNQYAKTKIRSTAKKSFAKYNWALNE